MGVWFWLNFVCMNKIGKDAEAKAGNSKVMSHAVPITK